jgi:hypothetical protein
MIDSFVDPDISVPTAVEIAIFVRDHAIGSCGLNTHGDIADFVVSHAESDSIFWSRGDDGELRAVMFGWPVAMNNILKKEPVYNPIGDILYVNLLVANDEVPDGEKMASIRSMKAMIDERHGGRVKKLAYHKGKIGDKLLIIPLV